MPDLRALSDEELLALGPSLDVYAELRRRLGERDRLLAAAEELIERGISVDYDDPRIGYLPAQVERIEYDALRSLLAECKEGK